MYPIYPISIYDIFLSDRMMGSIHQLDLHGYMDMVLVTLISIYCSLTIVHIIIILLYIRRHQLCLTGTSFV